MDFRYGRLTQDEDELQVMKELVERYSRSWRSQTVSKESNGPNKEAITSSSLPEHQDGEHVVSQRLSAIANSHWKFTFLALTELPVCYSN